MTSQRHARVKEVFLAACELPQPDRSAYLDEVCAGDPKLRDEVELLLAFDEKPDEETRPLATDSVGKYRLLQKIGEGGMGEVWEAEQKRPVRRRVAVKLIKWGMDTREVVARFESERQALVLMNHPNIAKAFEAGSTEEGRPYFVMEYVKGVPLTEYCDTNRLSTRERLEVFLQVCSGVQHAHQKGVIHRDIKPSNILVAVEDGRPVPKIIDFGVAKATSQRLTERTLFTELGQWIGTPEYMSPEQAQLTGLEVDTRTDVYALGVVLYEVLAGAQPFEPSELRGAGFDEMRRRIREDEPPRPRIEKDPTRRYGSPSDLAADVDRHLQNQPVLASPPSAAYRLRKFVRRNRAGVAASVVVLLALVAGVVGTSIGLIRAQREAETARQISQLLVGVFADVDPAGQMGHLSSTTAMLDRGVQRVTTELADQPVVQAQLMNTLGSGYRNLGLFDQAAPLLERSLRLRENHLGDDDAAVGDSCVSLGWLEYWKADYPEARALFQRAVGVFEQALGADHWAVSSSLGMLGTVCARTGDYEAAQMAFERSLEILRRTGREDEPVVATTTIAYAVMLMDLGKHDLAEPFLEQALALTESTFGPDHTVVGTVCLCLGRCFQETLRHDQARPLFERALEIQERALGPDHPALMQPLACLAMLDRRDRNYETAGSRYERAVAIGESALGPDHPDLVWVLNTYGLLLGNRDDSEGARATLYRALGIAEQAYGPVHLDVARVVENLGFHHYQFREYGEALSQYQRAFEIRKEVFGPEAPALGWNLYDQACLLALDGNPSAALVKLQGALDTGWANARIFADDDLDSLRGDPQFEAIVEQVRSRL
jgi:non-specific serine/threonine protein kinase/serine/threonine-protein kinase